MAILFCFLLLLFCPAHAIDLSVKVDENNFGSMLTNLNVVSMFNMTFKASLNGSDMVSDTIIFERYKDGDLDLEKSFSTAHFTQSNEKWEATIFDQISLNSISTNETVYKYRVVFVNFNEVTSGFVIVTLKRTGKLDETESIMPCGPLVATSETIQGTFKWPNELWSAPNVDCDICNSSCIIDFPNDGAERIIKTLNFVKPTYIYSYGIADIEDMSLSASEYEFQLVDMVVKVSKTFVCDGSLKVKKKSTTDSKSLFLFLSSSKASIGNPLFFNVPVGFYGETNVKNGGFMRFKQRVYADGASGHLKLENNAKMYLDYDFVNNFALTYPTSNGSTIDLLVPVETVNPLIGFQVYTAHYVFTTKFKISGSGGLIQIKGYARLHYALIYAKSVVEAIKLPTSTPTPTTTLTKIPPNEEPQPLVVIATKTPTLTNTLSVPPVPLFPDCNIETDDSDCLIDVSIFPTCNTAVDGDDVGCELPLSTSTQPAKAKVFPLGIKNRKPKRRPMVRLGVLEFGNSQLLCGSTYTENSYDIQNGATLIIDNTVSGENVCSVGSITSETGVTMKVSSNTAEPSTVTAHSGSTVSFIKVSETNMFDIKGDFIIQTGINLLVDVIVTPIDAVVARYETASCMKPSSTITITKDGGQCSDSSYTCKYEFNQEGSKHCQIRVFTELVVTTPAATPTSNSPQPANTTGTGTGVAQTVTIQKTSSSSDSNNGLWGLLALIAVPLLILGCIVMYCYYVRHNVEGEIEAEDDDVKEYVSEGSAKTPTPSPYAP